MRDTFFSIVGFFQQPSSRRKELARLKKVLKALPEPDSLPSAERKLAEDMSRLRSQILEQMGPVKSCATCAQGCPLPHGQWSGGFCCSGRTEEIFSEDELAGLKAVGVRISDLRPPRAEHAGCAFRGPLGCSLQPGHRPALCVIYICGDLSSELHTQGRFREIHSLVEELKDTFSRFCTLRAKRLQEEEERQWMIELGIVTKD